MDPRARNALVSATVTLVVALGYAGAFVVADRQSSSCESTAVLGCSGPFFAVLLVGTPVAYVVWAVALQVARVPLPWLAPLAVCAGLWVLLQVFAVADAVPSPLLGLLAAVALGAAWGLVPRVSLRRRRAGARL